MGKSERDTSIEHWDEVGGRNLSWPRSVREPSRTPRYERHRRRWPLFLLAAVVAVVLIAWLMRGTGSPA